MTRANTCRKSSKERDPILNNEIFYFHEQITYYGEEVALERLFEKTRNYQLSKYPLYRCSFLKNPPLANQWREVIYHFLKKEKKEKIDEICERLSEIDTAPLKLGGEYMLESFAFGIVGAFTFDFDYAHEIAKKVRDKMANQRIKKYRDFLIERI